MLGYYIYPLQKGTEYTTTDLENPEKVVELFDYCSIYEGVITKDGWDFLVDFYGYNRLFELDKLSSWFDEDNIEEYIESVKFARNGWQ